MAEEEKNKELADKVNKATCEQLAAQIEGDLRTLRAELPAKTAQAQAVETAKDVKYVKDRQQYLGCLFGYCTLFVLAY